MLCHLASYLLSLVPLVIYVPYLRVSRALLAPSAVQRRPGCACKHFLAVNQTLPSSVGVGRFFSLHKHAACCCFHSDLYSGFAAIDTK